MNQSPQRDFRILGMPLPLLREVSSVGLALVVFAATFRMVRNPLLALPIAGLVYWGARSWIQRVAAGEKSPIGRYVARLRNLAASLASDSPDSKSTAPIRVDAASRLLALANELERLDQKLEDRDGQAVEADLFIEVQMPRAVQLVERYADLASTPDPEERTREELREAEETLDLLLQAIREQSQRLVEQELREFAIDRRAFEALLRLDGVRSGASTATAARSSSEARQ